MKLQIDTNLKVIKLEQKANVKDIIDLLKKMFPEDWKDYDIDCNCIINWTYTNPWRPYNYNPWNLYSTPNYLGNAINQSNYNLGTILTSCSSDAPNIINVQTN